MRFKPFEKDASALSNSIEPWIGPRPIAKDPEEDKLSGPPAQLLGAAGLRMRPDRGRWARREFG